jgi:hypothetical protein
MPPTVDAGSTTEDLKRAQSERGRPIAAGDRIDAHLSSGKLVRCPQTFVVLNHPFWDLGGIGLLRHESVLLAFLCAHRGRIHAIELNGYRAWAENRRVLPPAEGFGLPIVGGGDRHGNIPNAILNVSGATCVAEFATDLRAGRWMKGLFGLARADGRGMLEADCNPQSVIDTAPLLGSPRSTAAV